MVSGLRFRVLDIESRVYIFRYRVQGLGSGV